VSAGRPIPVLAQHTFPGNVILSARATSGLAPPSLPDAELEKLCLAHLAGAPPPRGRSPLARARGSCHLVCMQCARMLRHSTSSQRYGLQPQPVSIWTSSSLPLANLAIFVEHSPGCI